MIPNAVLLTFGTNYSDWSIGSRVFFMWAAFVVYFFPILLINPRVYLLIASPLVLFIPIESMSIILSGQQSSPGIIMSLIQTDVREATEFMEGESLILYVTPLLIILYLWSLTLGWPQSSHNKYRKIRIYFVYFFVVFVVAFFSKNLLGGSSVSATYKEIIDRGSNYASIAYPFGTLIKAIIAVNEIQKFATHQERAEGFSFDAYKKDELSDREVYVFILGESVRYANWHMNGYARNTSPRLSSRKGLISFSDMASGANFTQWANPLLLTRATAETRNISIDEKSFLAAFRESGFRVYWISNNPQYGIHNTATTMHAGDADQLIFPFGDTSPLERGAYDGDLLPLFKEVIGRQERRVLVVLHMAGSHYNYNARYPPEYQKFRPVLHGDCYNLIWLTSVDQNCKEQSINSYDNSILYADYFISSVIDTIELMSSVSAVVFLSDHGEDLFDDERNLFLHGSPDGTRYQFHVPMFIWLSESYRSAYPEKADSILAHKGRSLGSDNVFFSILDMANIGYVAEDLTMSFASDRLSIRPRKVLTASGAVVDLDDIQ